MGKSHGKFEWAWLFRYMPSYLCKNPLTQINSLQLPRKKVKVANFTIDWRDGKILADLIDFLQPKALPVLAKRPKIAFELAEICIKAASM